MEKIAVKMDITVRIEYRMKAGSSLPRWKALRARVANGDLLGKDLLPATICSVDLAVAKCLLALQWCEKVTFIFDPIMEQRKRTYFRGSFLGYDLVQ